MRTSMSVVTVEMIGIARITPRSHAPSRPSTGARARYPAGCRPVVPTGPPPSAWPVSWSAGGTAAKRDATGGDRALRRALRNNPARVEEEQREEGTEHE